MTQAERGLFERIYDLSFSPDADFHCDEVVVVDDIRPIVAEFELRLAEAEREREIMSKNYDMALQRLVLATNKFIPANRLDEFEAEWIKQRDGLRSTAPLPEKKYDQPNQP